MTDSRQEPAWVHELAGKTGTRLAAFWGFAEATLFFVVPDVLFTLTTLFGPKRGLRQLAAAVVGATIGGAVMFSWAATSPVVARATVAAVPFVGEKIITPAEARWDQTGTRVLFDGPLNGVPFKTYAVLAPSHLSGQTFSLLSIPMRLERFLIVWVAFLLIGRLLARLVGGRRYQIAALTVHGACWTAVYAAYWTANS